MMDKEVDTLSDNIAKQFGITELFIRIDRDQLESILMDSDEEDDFQRVTGEDVICAMTVEATEKDAADMSEENDLILRVEVKSVKKVVAQPPYLLKSIR